MKIIGSTVSGASLAVLVIQLALVSSIAAKYLYQRGHCARVWTQAVMYDPNLVMRGRYLSMQLYVDGCESTLPSAKQARYPRTVEGLPQGDRFAIGDPQPWVNFQAKLKVEHNRLIVIRIPDGDDASHGEWVTAPARVQCDQMHLTDPVNFYIAEHAQNPLPAKPGQELWVEVTVPPHGPPRPIQLALKTNGVWNVLALE
jgi:hypothetical protein